MEQTTEIVIVTVSVGSLGGTYRTCLYDCWLQSIIEEILCNGATPKVVFFRYVLCQLLYVAPVARCVVVISIYFVAIIFIAQGPFNRRCRAKHLLAPSSCPSAG